MIIFEKNIISKIENFTPPKTLKNKKHSVFYRTEILFIPKNGLYKIENRVFEYLWIERNLLIGDIKIRRLHEALANIT